MTKIHRTKANERLHAPALTPRCTHGARAAEAAPAAARKSASARSAVVGSPTVAAARPQRRPQGTPMPER